MTLTDPVAGGRVRLGFEAPVGVSGRVLEDALNSRLGLRRSWFVGSRPLADLVLGTAPLTSSFAVAPSASRPTKEGFVLVCTEGPDSGAEFPLVRGRHRVGKDAADVAIRDPALLPEEGELVVDGHGVTWRPRTGPMRRLVLGRTQRWGRSRVVLAAEKPAPRGLGTLPGLAPLEVETDPAGSGWKAMLLTAALPVAAATVIGLLFHLWFLLLFGLVGALGSVVHWLSRGSGRARNRARLREACALEAARSEEAVPPVGLQVRCDPPPPAGAPVLRWGRGTRPAHLAPSHHGTRVPEILDAVILTRLSCPLVLEQDVPVPVVDSVLAQILAQGRELCLVIPDSSTQPSPLLRRWADHPSVRFLPSPGPLQPSSTGLGPVVVLAGSPSEWPSLVSRCETPELVCLADDALPASAPPAPGTTTFLRIRSAGEGELELELHGPAQDQPGFQHRPVIRCTAPDGLGPTARSFLAASVARAAVPVLPRLSRRHDLALDGVRRRWHGALESSELVVELGSALEAGDAPVSVDLNLHGPHGVIAGTTGAGKSELIKSVLLSLALRYPPARLSMVLIDFKGAASFGLVADLPHVQALLTDLEEDRVMRDLAFLQFELTRREQVLRSAGCSSWAELLARDPAALRRENLPELLVCVDEFRLLVESFPEAMKQLLRIATVGRSLGLHLLLATQRPQGAISSDIRANVSVNVCLRVASEADSLNVLGAAGAERIPAEQPGRGLLSCDGTLQPFRGLYADAAPESTTAAGVRLTSPPSGQPLPEHGTQELAPLVRSLRQAEEERVATGGCTPRPVIPTLPEPVGITADVEAESPSGSTPRTLPLGQAESPELGWHGPLNWNPALHGAVEFLGAGTDQQRWSEHLLRWAHRHDAPVYAFCASRDVADRMRHVAPGAEASHGVTLSSSPEFYVEALRELLAEFRADQEVERGPVVVIFQGLDRAVEDLMKYGVSLEPLVDELLAQAANRHWVTTIGTRRLPSSLRPQIRTVLHSGEHARKEFDLARPRAARAVLRDAVLVDGALVPARPRPPS